MGYYDIHPWNLTWNLKRSPWKKRCLLETIIFRFHVKFRGSTRRFATLQWLEKNKKIVPQMVGFYGEEKTMVESVKKYKKEANPRLKENTSLPGDSIVGVDDSSLKGSRWTTIPKRSRIEWPSILWFWGCLAPHVVGKYIILSSPLSLPQYHRVVALRKFFIQLGFVDHLSESPPGFSPTSNSRLRFPRPKMLSQMG